MIINIASVGGMRAEFGLGVYNVTKAALIHLTRQLAGELGPTRVVGIAPGLVQTDFAVVPRRELRRRTWRRACRRKRLGEPEDIANLAVFLASDKASWITGETYVIDGGAGVAQNALSLRRVCSAADGGRSGTEDPPECFPLSECLLRGVPAANTPRSPFSRRWGGGRTSWPASRHASP